MRLFKRGATPIKQVVSEKDCKRTYKYVTLISERTTLIGDSFTQEFGFTVEHKIHDKEVTLTELLGSYPPSTATVRHKDSVVALRNILNEILDNWEAGENDQT